MIKKQLGLLAGSVMVAATSNAAITLDGNSLAVFSTAGAGSYYQLIGGSTGDLLASGTGYSVDISAAASALGGTIDSFALFAINSSELTTTAGTAPGYNYTEFLYVSEGGGLVYAGDTATSTTNLAAGNAISTINAILSNANLGFNGEGTLGDFDYFAQVAFYLNSGSSAYINGSNMNLYGTSVIFNEQTTTSAATNAQLITLTSPAGPIIPIPTTAGLFGSALAGLLVAKKKHKK
ncbi:hypothetical protein N9Z31_03565 [Pseudomonadales bacterium]|nr:hypothetical protein [Pseudomonadales bacterium]MDB4363219.1 hypothetical protein [Pseudomonadales bacterium]